MTAAGPGGALQAVLWDMDGLLVDSEPLWTIAEEALADHYGARWTESIKAACIGKHLDASVPVMLAAFGVEASPRELAFASTFLLDRMQALFADGPALLPGVEELLAGLAQQGIPCALVSSSYRVLVDACLSGLGGEAVTRPPFAITVAGDEVERHKPDPEPYLRAAAALGCDPGACVVLEDSATGALAGVAAGCPTVLVPGTSVPAPAANPGWVTLPTLAGVPVARLRALVAVVA